MVRSCIRPMAARPGCRAWVSWSLVLSLFRVREREPCALRCAGSCCFATKYVTRVEFSLYGSIHLMTDKAFDITGKVTIVTGGGTGIGADIAKVMITSRTMDHLGPVAEEIRKAGGTVEAMVCDVRQNAQVEAVVNKAVETWGQVDVLINNAGASFVAHAHDISPNGFAAIVAINLNGTFL